MNKRFLFDEEYIKKYKYVIGTDEAGRGPGAGDVFASAVCFYSIDDNTKKLLKNLKDSKKLSEHERNELYEIITKKSIWTIERGSVEEIEKYNILRVSLNLMKRCVENLAKKIETTNFIVLIDGNKKITGVEYNQETVIKGDNKSAAIAAASIIAKVERDKYMYELDKEFPEYRWKDNKGYITKQHLEAVDKFGLCKYHRKSFFVKHFEKSEQLSLW